MPAFLANDVLRLWRTLCVNYEAGTRTEPPEEKAKRKLKNFKLKHSRLLTCYSALLYLLYVYVNRNTVSPQDAREMVELTPTGRLEFLIGQSELSPVHEKIRILIQRYESFLDTTNQSKSSLMAQFLDREQGHKLLLEAFQFGELVFDVLTEIGKGSRFHRLLVV
jgi:predicted nucleic acid-binding protein